MSGNFARGFMETFPTSFAMASKRKQDAWDKTWDKWNQREELGRKARERFDEVYNRANVIVEHFGQGNVPEGAASYLADRMMRGLTDDEAKKLAQEGKWVASELPAGQVNPNRTEQSQVNQQTDAVMGLNQPQMPQQEPQGLLGGLVSGGKSFLQNMRLSPEEKALQDFAKEKGITVDQLKQRLGNGAVSIVPEEQQANAQQAQRFSVQMPTKPESPLIDPADRAAAIQSVSKDAKDAVNELNLKRNVVVSMYRDFKDLNDIVNETEGAVLADGVANFSQFISALDQNFKAALGLVSRNSQEGQRVGEIRDMVVSGEFTLEQGANETARIVGLLEKSNSGQNIENVAQARTLMEMKTQLLAYKIAMLYGQDGRNLAEAERIMFMQAARSGNSPEKFRQNVSSLLNGEVARLEDSRQAIKNIPTIATFPEAYGEEYPGTQLLMGSSIEEAIKSDPVAKEMYDLISNTTQQKDFGLEVGTVENGYKYLGGDPGLEESWQRVQ